MSNGILYARSLPITEKISITVPTVGDILRDEETYYGATTSIIATPYDFMVQLSDAGIEFDAITEFDLFLLLFPSLAKADTRLVFGELDLGGFEIAVNNQNGKVSLVDQENDIVIDKAIHHRISAAIREINSIEKVNKKPGNGEARKYMIERMRIKQKRAARKQRKSQLEDEIIALVNTQQFKYDYTSVLDLSIYQFKASLNQIVRKTNYDNLMHGCYSGTVKVKELSQDQLNWIYQTKQGG